MVQGWAQDGKGDPTEYTAYRCPACGSVHLVNPRTGKLASDERGPKKGDEEKR
jgi:DNA-directed RNA polymerase subunit RPC12/RpoP